MSTIRLITEAFSMQPVTFTISTQKEYDKRCMRESGDDALIKTSENLIKEIRLESIPCGPDVYMKYCGYNFQGERKFEYLASSVNVHYV